MRHARAVLKDLVLHVEPPKGCAIVLTERPSNKPSDANWVATVGPMGANYIRRLHRKGSRAAQDGPESRLVWGCGSGWNASYSTPIFRVICRAHLGRSSDAEEAALWWWR
jgi:hypothetical protein